MLERVDDGAGQGLRALYALADTNTARLLRTLSLAGPTPVGVLAERLALRPAVVRDILARTSALGLVRSRPGLQTHYELDADALRAAVVRNRDTLLGATA